MAYLENERDAENYQGWSLTRVYVEELTQFSSPDADPQAAGHPALPARDQVPDEMHLQPRRPRPLWVKVDVHRQRPVQHRHRRRDRHHPRVHPVEGQRQSGAARERSRLRQPAEGGRLAAAGDGMAGGRLGRHRGRVLPGIRPQAATSSTVPDPDRLDQVPLDGLGLGHAVLGRLVGGVQDDFEHDGPHHPPRRDRPLPRVVRGQARPSQRRPADDRRGGRRRHRRAGKPTRPASASTSPTASSTRRPSRSSPARRSPKRWSGTASTSAAPTIPASPATRRWAAGTRSAPG